jgi:tetraacyldisaccharide 4'-kinase
LAHHLQEMGKNPHILSRGYGSHVDIPTLVDLKLHKASDVGDEPLLLAQTAPTWVFKDRVTSGRMAIDAGADVLIMDDGFQNPTIYKDLSFIVVDGKQGFGNGCVLPAGPLRENISQGLKRADAIIMIGDNQQGLKFDIPVLQANIQCLNPNPQNVYAFTGLGFPEKFFQTLRELRYEVVQTKSFADHHPYTRQEIDDLIKSAADLNVRLITTEKDALRIFLDQMPFIDVLNVELIFNNTDQLNTMLHKVHS